MSLSSDSMANSSLKKGLIIVHHSWSPTIFLRVIWELSQVLAEPWRASQKLSNAALLAKLLADIILSTLLTNSLPVRESLSFWPQNLGSLVCWAFRARPPSTPWTTCAWAIGTLFTSWQGWWAGPLVVDPGFAAARCLAAEVVVAWGFDRWLGCQQYLKFVVQTKSTTF